MSSNRLIYLIVEIMCIVLFALFILCNLIFQKEILKKLIERKQAQIRRVHSGLACYREGVREIPVESIPGILEAGWVPQQPERPSSAARSSSRSSDDPDFLYNAFKTILTSTKNHQTAW